ncbi:hypothetical protein HIV01_014895 [Lysobacter arenosi]|uniref:Uncharacterized protein n=1 Tax=Lysobacter arenosi TaxID=2795387 RepID=A0ABX7RC18_9GAMM|nr:hypothetical protein [Lysobacter arenosi]QSX74456.1 hypothetical protein HIV01_014895 [Lysobacter arenosi]
MSEACTSCNKQIPRAHRRDLEGGYCLACYHLLFKHRPCQRCGEMARAREDDPTPLCNGCRDIVLRERRSCDRCGDLIGPRGILRRDGSACCRRCRRYMWPDRTCAYCGFTGKRVTRNYALGFDQPACSSCQTKRSAHVTCAGCRRPRTPAGERDGRVYCAHCLPTGAPALIHCQGCGRWRPGYSKTHCEDCGWERLHEVLLTRLKPQLTRGWTRELFAQYHRHARLASKRGQWYKALKRDIGFFVAIELAFGDREEVTSVLIVRRLGHEFVHKHQRAMSFMAHQGVIGLDNEPDYRLELAISRLQHLLEDDSPWIHQVLQRFMQRMVTTRARITNRSKHGRIPIQPKSIESALRAAHQLLAFAKVEYRASSIQEVNQEVLDRFLGINPLRGARVRAFVRHINQRERSFHKLSVPSVRRPFPYHSVLPTERRLELAQAFAKVSPSQADMRMGLISLFILVYAQTAVRASRIRLDAIRETPTGYEIKFAKLWMEVDPLLTKPLMSWLTRRREFSAFDETDTSPFLFPGRIATTATDSKSIAKWLRRYQVGTNQLRITAIAAMVTGGVRQPRVLVDCFGISSDTAILFCQALGSFDMARAAHVMNTYGA